MTRFSTRLRFGLARMLLAGSTKAANLSIVPSWVTTSVLDPTFNSLVRDGYKKSSAFFACVSALSFAFPEPLLHIYDNEADDAQILAQHSLRKLIKRPMPIMGEAELMSTTCAYLAIGGNAYWHKVRGAGGRVVQLRPFHAGHMIAIPGGDNWVQGYRYDQAGAGGKGSETSNMPLIPADDVVHFKWPAPDPSQPWQSLPPIVAAATEVDTDVEAVRYIYALLKNDAIPRTIVTVPADRPLDDDEYKRVKAQWREKYGGDNRGDVAILEAGATVSRLGLNLQELAFDALAKIPESRIAAAMRVPPIVAGLNVGLDRSTYANYKEARVAFTLDTLIPLWRIVASEITADLLPEFTAGADRRAVEARFDMSRVAALKEDRAARFVYITTAYKEQLLTKNEARAALGFANVPNGDAFASTPAAPAGAAQLTDEQAPKTVVINPDGSIVPAGAATILLKAGALQQPEQPEQPELKVDLEALEAEIAPKLNAYLRAQYKKAAAGIRNAGKADELDPAIVDQLGLDLGVEVTTIMQRHWPKALKKAFESAGAALTLDLAFNVDNPNVQKVLADLAKQIVRVTATTRAEVRALVGKQAAEGWSLDRLAKEIAQLAGIHSRKRATIIARTETAAAYSRGSLLAYKISDVVEGVKWLATIDEQTCVFCKELNGTTAALGSSFADGTDHPPRHPNCRCALAPIVKK